MYRINTCEVNVFVLTILFPKTREQSFPSTQIKVTYHRNSSVNPNFMTRRQDEGRDNECTPEDFQFFLSQTCTTPPADLTAHPLNAGILKFRAKLRANYTASAWDGDVSPQPNLFPVERTPGKPSKGRGRRISLFSLFHFRGAPVTCFGEVILLLSTRERRPQASRS